ncbi:unnamed protein product [Durusdinium trenchii]|uniref:Uncharacterized protein n=2 Tax=Durusdinium trenchii TaxID=1381693 RepID=A0ABP0Q0I5_9DINO
MASQMAGEEDGDAIRLLLPEHRFQLELDPEPMEGEAVPRSWRRAITVLTLGCAAALLLGTIGLRHRHVGFLQGLRRNVDLAPAFISLQSVFAVDASSDDSSMEFMDAVAGLSGIPYTPAQLQTKRDEWRNPTVTELPSVNVTPPPTQQRATLNSNDCLRGEEYFAGACYANCSNLTAGQFPIRSSPNTCCKREPCIFPSLLSFSGYFVCMGYGVDSRGACPRQPGKCNSDEELFEGQCYRQCGTLTQNEYPYRTGPLSCCKFEPPCFNLFNIKSEGIGPCSGYNVGGISHDCAHDPQV